MNTKEPTVHRAVGSFAKAAFAAFFIYESVFAST